ncbi:MAG: hypothetical protein NC548_61570 [Lachnospiraceae bacterium]|nr:hypothetical protein [Lachnospiraceae bacterium]
MKKTTEQFIEESINLYGNRFDYSKVRYISAHNKVCIICPEYGEFWQTPSGHLHGVGCVECVNFIRDTDTFIQKAKAVHGDKYDYSKTIYKNSKTPVEIICPTHGVFKQKPQAHAAGKGCPSCACEGRRKGACGIGINDVIYAKHYRSYYIWRGMIARTNSKITKGKQLTYKVATVCDEWLRYSNFKRWFDDPLNGYVDGYHLDKDIIIQGNTHYSPTTCCFVPHEINILLRGRIGKPHFHNGKQLPTGVTFLKGKYIATLHKGGKYIVVARCNNPDVAFQSYKLAKHKHIIEVANQFYNEGKITLRVYDAILKFNVEKYG